MKTKDKPGEKILVETMAKDVDSTINILPLDVYKAAYIQSRSKMNSIMKMLASGVFMFYFSLFVALCHYSKSSIVIGLSYAIVILTSIGAVYALSQRETDFEIRE